MLCMSPNTPKRHPKSLLNIPKYHPKTLPRCPEMSTQKNGKVPKAPEMLQNAVLKHCPKALRRPKTLWKAPKDLKIPWNTQNAPQRHRDTTPPRNNHRHPQMPQNIPIYNIWTPRNFQKCCSETLPWNAPKCPKMLHQNTFVYLKILSLNRIPKHSQVPQHTALTPQNATLKESKNDVLKCCPKTKMISRMPQKSVPEAPKHCSETPPKCHHTATEHLQLPQKTMIETQHPKKLLQCAKCFKTPPKYCPVSCWNAPKCSHNTPQCPKMPFWNTSNCHPEKKRLNHLQNCPEIPPELDLEHPKILLWNKPKLHQVTAKLSRFTALMPWNPPKLPWNTPKHSCDTLKTNKQKNLKASQNTLVCCPRTQQWNAWSHPAKQLWNRTPQNSSDTPK